MPLVKNLKELAQTKPSKHASWLDYWKEQTGEEALSCSAQACYGRDIQAAPVAKVEDVFEEPYLAPLCSACRQREDEFYVSVELVAMK